MIRPSAAKKLNFTLGYLLEVKKPSASEEPGENVLAACKITKIIIKNPFRFDGIMPAIRINFSANVLLTFVGGVAFAFVIV